MERGCLERNAIYLDNGKRPREKREMKWKQRGRGREREVETFNYCVFFLFSSLLFSRSLCGRLSMYINVYAYHSPFKIVEKALYE